MVKSWVCNHVSLEILWVYNSTYVPAFLNQSKTLTWLQKTHNGSGQSLICHSNRVHLWGVPPPSLPKTSNASRASWIDGGGAAGFGGKSSADMYPQLIHADWKILGSNDTQASNESCTTPSHFAASTSSCPANSMAAGNSTCEHDAIIDARCTLIRNDQLLMIQSRIMCSAHDLHEHML